MQDLISMPTLWEIITWVILVGVGTVLYKFYDRHTTYKERKPNAFRELYSTMDTQIKGLQARIEAMESERKMYHEKIMDLHRELMESKATIIVLEQKVKYLTEKQESRNRRNQKNTPDLNS